MFFIRGKSGNTSPYLYLIGMVVIMLSYILGQGPMFLAIKQAIDSNPEIGPEAYNRFEETTDFTVLGMSSNYGFFLMITIFAVASIGLYIVLRFLHQKSFLSIVTAYQSIDWSRILVSWVLWFILGCIIEVCYYFAMPENYSFEVNWSNWFVLLIIALFYLPVQSSLEEFIFRGYLFQAFGLFSSKKYMPIIITAILFALPHSFNPEIDKFGFVPMFSYYILAGILLGIIVVMDDRLELALGVHAATNFFGAAILGYEGSVLQTDTLFTQSTVYPWLMTLTFFVAGMLFLLACQRLYEWPSFQKLTDPIILQKEETPIS